MAKAAGGSWKAVKLTEDYQHYLPAMEAAIDANTKLVYITNPHNPTAKLLLPSLAPGLSCFPFILEFPGNDYLAKAAMADL